MTTTMVCRKMLLRLQGVGGRGRSRRRRGTIALNLIAYAAIGILASSLMPSPRAVQARLNDVVLGDSKLPAPTVGEDKNRLNNRRLDEGGPSFSFQPKVTVLERSKVIGSISMSTGSPWCPGRPKKSAKQPMIWLVGHQTPERPVCYNATGDRWELNDAVKLQNDVDRHDCVHLDVNNDGLEDIVCLVGAKKGRGKGENELYLTQKDGSLNKVPEHGLQKYPTLSTRVAAKLRRKGGGRLIFVGTTDRERPDGHLNAHRMFLVLKSGVAPYFVEFPGPWTKNKFYATCAEVVDINGDGLDDLIVCSKTGKSHMYVQKSDGKFVEIKIPKNEHTSVGVWRNVRVQSLNKGGRPDLIVVEGSVPTTDRAGTAESDYFIRIFRGREKAPFFNFRSPYYSKALPHGTYDVEVFDANADGILDLFVTQANERLDSQSRKLPYF